MCNLPGFISWLSEIAISAKWVWLIVFSFRAAFVFLGFLALSLPTPFLRITTMVCCFVSSVPIDRINSITTMVWCFALFVCNNKLIVLQKYIGNVRE